MKDQLGLTKDNYVLSIKPRQASSKNKRKSLYDRASLPTASLLISPNGFKILDILFKLDEENLKEFRSALSFATRFSVNQPKLSKIMRTLKVRSPYELKGAIRDLPDEWWQSALVDKSTYRRLTPFFLVDRPHYSLLKMPPKQLNDELAKFIESSSDLFTGPLEVAKDFGVLRDDDFSIWGTKESLHSMKTKFKLIPGMTKEDPVWHLGSPRYSFEAEALLTKINKSTSKMKRANISHMNIFRSIWDLGFGTERLKELQILMIKKALHEL